MMEVVSNNYMPGDPRLIDHIVYELKSQGIFDNFRKECIADVDTKPAYQNLRQRVEGSVSGFLKTQRWRPDMNKNHVREMLRRNISESGFLETGVERIVDQVVNPKINTIFLPQVENVVYKFLGIEKPTVFDDFKLLSGINDSNDLLPNDLEAVSPESESFERKLDASNDSQKLDDSKMDDDESPPFEPLDELSRFHGHEENSVDSNLSGFSGLVSHDSNHSIEQTTNRPIPMEMSCDDSQVSKQSSEDQLSIVIPEETQTKMDISEDSSNSKTIDPQPKSADANPETCSTFQNITKQEKTDTSKKIDEKKSDKHRSSHKHKSRSDSKSEKDKKSDRDKKDHKDKSKQDSKDGKDKDKKDSKSRSSSSNKHGNTKKHSSDSKDGKSKDSKSKTESSKNKEDLKIQTSNSSGGKSKGDTKSHSKHNGKTKTDSSDSTKSSVKTSKKDEKPPKKEDKQHSRSDKHTSSNKKDKDKKSSKKEIKDDHFGLKGKKSGRRSTDRDSSDGHSGTQSSSSSFAEVSATSQLQKTNQDSSVANSGSTSGDSGSSEQVDEKIVQDTIVLSKPRVQLKLIKPKFASNIFEARKLMKIRKKLGKLEKQKQIELISSNVSVSDDDNNQNTDGKSETDNSISTNTVSEAEPEPEPVKEVIEKAAEIEDNLVITQNAVISKESWDAVEAKLSSGIDYDSYVDQSELEIDDVKVVEVDECVDCDSCLGYSSESTIESRKQMELLNRTINKLEEDVMKRYKSYLLRLASKNVPTESFKEMDDFNKRLPKVDIVDVTIDNEIIITPSKGIKRLVDEQTDVHNNNKKIAQIETHCSDEKAIQPTKPITSKTKKPKLINNSINHLDNFNLPPSPADSDKSFTAVVDKNEIKNKKIRVNNTRNQNQRYSSEDLYKPRLQFSSTRRRANKNMD